VRVTDESVSSGISPELMSHRMAKHTNTHNMQYQILATEGELWQSILVAETNDLEVAERMLENTHPMLPANAALFIYDKKNQEIRTYEVN